MTAWSYICIAIIALLAVAVILWYRHRTKRTMRRLDQMLDTAIRGDFREDAFDESMLSAMETKLARYLAASTVSARRVQEEKDKIKELIADISHQTKTPISNVLLYTQLLAEQDLTAEGTRCVGALDAQAKKLQTLIEALVKTSRLESGVITLHPAPGLVQPVLESATMQLRPKAEAKGIALVLEPGDAEAVFDLKWTEEAVFNLLDNAVKYTPPGGTVSIGAEVYPLFVSVNVRDTGPGIPEAEQPKVFQRFYRGAEHQTEEGVGIGLYLTRQIAEGQGGYVKASTPREGGSVFSLYLPRT